MVVRCLHAKGGITADEGADYSTAARWVNDRKSGRRIDVREYVAVACREGISGLQRFS
jgi:hypothetical protein